MFMYIWFCTLCKIALIMEMLPCCVHVLYILWNILNSSHVDQWVVSSINETMTCKVCRTKMAPSFWKLSTFFSLVMTPSVTSDRELKQSVITWTMYYMYSIQYMRPKRPLYIEKCSYLWIITPSFINIIFRHQPLIQTEIAITVSYWTKKYLSQYQVFCLVLKTDIRQQEGNGERLKVLTQTIIHWKSHHMLAIIHVP